MQRNGTTSGYHRLVIKLGTNLITAGGDNLDREMMTSLVEQVAQLCERGLQAIIVSSGAVAAGKHRLGIKKRRRDIPFRQMLAAVGQCRLMQAYDELFSARGITVAQTLLTRPDFLNRLGYLNARNTLLALLELGVVPIVNENDVVFVEELEGTVFGDNDNLSAMVANLVDADLLIILSDVAGLYTSDPNQDATARLIPQVERIDQSIEDLAGGRCGERGVGGMATKIEAARLATSSGTAVVITSGQEPRVILRLVEGEALGTFFSPVTTGIESRKRWMLSLPVKGRIAIDAGAKTALQKRNKSLLPAGVVRVEGRFERGDVVAIIDSQDLSLATGISNYSSADIAQIKGCRSDSIQGILCYEYGDEVVHRDNLVVF
ncbi:MAG: glutamate 5-kinase [Dehalococcoidia bacterium]|nr:Glutamate 5-kinase [Chloroflexota bacterium]MBT9159994.1 Glutamate 5-kinase [Chloroflexota bacterium]MBT9162585.1 Glutamate 5-kinase [Chloroflexota bacterium]